MISKCIDVHCPDCAKLDRKKLLFRHTPSTQGTVVAFCKGCKKEIKIELGKESRRAAD